MFDEDGHGTRGYFCVSAEDDGEVFKWSTNDFGILSLDFGDEFIEEWSYVIEDNVLTITSEHWVGLTYSYVRIVSDGKDEFVGTWAWDGNRTWQYVFEADGYGTRPGEIDLETFEWMLIADGGLLIIDADGWVEMWSYVIEDGRLTITSRQFVGVEFRYNRVDRELPT